MEEERVSLLKASVNEQRKEIKKIFAKNEERRQGVIREMSVIVN